MMANQFDWDGKGERPKYEYKMSEEALDMNHNLTPRDKELILMLQKIIYEGTCMIEDNLIKQEKKHGNLTDH